MSVRRSLFVLPLLFAAPLPLYAQAAPVAQPAPVAELIKKVDIPYQEFTLPNGLRVIVHTDRKAPIVAVSVWYHVGGKDEVKGKTGFAHLFEHLMFNGSENSPSDFFGPLQQVGATDYNGTTWYDRTNYFESVPTPALETALFLESDRMGHLLGGIDQAKLDNQIGVVQNEKREGDNQPFGLVDYYTMKAMLPETHPYYHDVIGSMADLSAASLEDVKGWFRAKYGPDNAVLVLAGDIDVAKAKPLVTKWFGDIPRGPAITRVKADIPTLAAPKTIALKDRVPYTRIMRYWTVEGVNGKDTAALDVAASVLGGLSSSRLDNALVRKEQTAVSVTAGLQALEQIGIFSVSADVKPGGDAAAVGKRLDEIIADLIAKGPTADEVRRVATRSISGTIGGFESVGGFGGKAVALAEGAVYSNNPAKYKADLTELAAMTPAKVQAAMKRWITRPVVNVIVEPGDRDRSPAALAMTGDVSTDAAPAAKTPAPVVESVAAKLTRVAPPLGAFPPLDFPAIERTTLSNGIPVYFARRSETPVVRVQVSFDAGAAADPKDAFGLQALTMSLLDEGTTTRNSVQIAEEQERLGANVSSAGGLDRSGVGLYALTANLAPSLDLLADVVRNPAFDPQEVERLRAQQLAGISAQLSQPQGIANAIVPAKLYGDAYPYGRPFAGLGTPASVKAITRDAVVSFQRNWLVPDKAAIFVVGDTTMAQIKPLLDDRFGKWPANRMARPTKDFTAAPIAPSAMKIYLADRPQSPQSVISGGQVLAITGTDPSLLVLNQSNAILGGNFLSRLNTDLRETKGWSYGVRTGIQTLENRLPFIITAPVQADRTGDSVEAVLDNIKAFIGPKGTTAEELERATNNSVRQLPGQFETSDAIMTAMQRIVYLKRPDNYYETLADQYRKMTAAELDAAMRGAIDPSKFVIVVVGDAAKVKPQLDKLGIPVEQVQLPASN
ncbi:MAG: pitrilysin family protein [Sphingomonadales bacterium]